MCLLGKNVHVDIKVKEQSIENMARGRKIYEPPRYMTINQAVEQLLEIEEKRNEKVYTKDTIAVGLARLGTDTQQITSGTLEELLTVDFGAPLHSLVIAGQMHFLEADLLASFSVNPETFKQHASIIH